MKPRMPPMTNTVAGSETAFRHDHLQAIPKRLTSLEVKGQKTRSNLCRKNPLQRDLCRQLASRGRGGGGAGLVTGSPLGYATDRCIINEEKRTAPACCRTRGSTDD